MMQSTNSDEMPAGCISRLAGVGQVLGEPLPGLDAQMRMAPSGRITDSYNPNPAGARHAGVLLAITADDELIFIRRAHDGGAHSGQIAFPGGAWEPGDSNLQMTALREAEEEIGLPVRKTTLLGALTPLYIPVSNFVVHPFVGCVDELPEFVCQPSEVDEVVVLSIDRLADSCGKLEFDQRGTVQTAPCYRHNGIEIWGATAMITSEFLWVWESTRS